MASNDDPGVPHDEFLSNQEFQMGPLTEETLITSILMSMITLVGVIGNCLMLRAYIKYPKLRTHFYTVFCSLSIADMVFLLVATPSYIEKVVVMAGEETPDPDDVKAAIPWCKAGHYIMGVCSFIAAFLIVALAALRTILLTHRNRATQPKPIHMVAMSVLFYIVAFFASYPLIDTVTISYDDGSCYFRNEDNPKLRRKEVWLYNLFSMFLPLGLVSVIHLIAYVVGKRFFSDSYSPREKEKSRLIICIIIAFAVCQLPYRIIQIYYEYYPARDDEEYIHQTMVKSYLMCLLMVDKCVRPILYSKLASDLCVAFDEIINCTYCAKASNRGSYREPLYDRPSIGPGIVIPEDDMPYCDSNAHGNCNGGDPSLYGSGSAVSDDNYESQQTLTENVEVHIEGQKGSGSDSAFSSSNGEITPTILCTRSDPVLSKETDEDVKSNETRMNAVESLGRSFHRLTSTSSEMSYNSVTSQTPLVRPVDEEEELEMSSGVV